MKRIIAVLFCVVMLQVGTVYALTLEELRAATEATKIKIEVLEQEMGRLTSFINEVEMQIYSDYAETIDVDAFILIQAPIYAVIKSSVQAAAADLP